jgi:perosamine synthetase
MYALQIDSKKYGRTRDELIQLFSKEQIEVRPVWYPNHLQQPYKDCQAYQIEQANSLWEKTLNIPCSVSVRKNDLLKVVGCLKKWKK